MNEVIPEWNGNMVHGYHSWESDDYILKQQQGSNKTRTTRTPAFWGYPSPPHDYPYYWVILHPKWKEDKVKVTNSKNLPNYKFLNFKQTLHGTHPLMLLDKMWKYEMVPTSIVEDTERTRFCPQTDRRTDGRTEGRADGRTSWNQYTPLSTSLKRG